MKKVLLFLSVGLLSNVYACDVCGGFFGILPYDNQSNITLMHRYRLFNGYRTYQQKSTFFPVGAYKTLHGTHTTDSVKTENYSAKDYESYKVFELRCKFFIHKRVEINAFLPLVNNKSKEDELKNNVTGIGDPNLFAAFHMLVPKAEHAIKHRLILGGGIKLPSGNYYAKNSTGKRLPLLLQPGTGSVDYFFFNTYVFSYNKIGFSNTFNYKINGYNFYNEKIANGLSNFSSVFFKVKANQFNFIPSLTAYHEQTNGVLVKNDLMEGTAMHEWMFGIGFDIYYKNFGLNMGMQKTLWQIEQTNELSSVGRFYISLTYNFNQQKYLLGTRKSE
ncbi:MAG: hypothetical protein IPM51_07885 [Sphingobacteriaceae bacterium]|nr:hypothetical protein [Sphingobacteriaceae bacterium]